MVYPPLSISYYLGVILAWNTITDAMVGSPCEANSNGIPTVYVFLDVSTSLDPLNPFPSTCIMTTVRTITELDPSLGTPYMVFLNSFSRFVAKYYIYVESCSSQWSRNGVFCCLFFLYSLV